MQGPKTLQKAKAKAELYALISQLSDRDCAVWTAVIERIGATKGAGPMIPAMTLTLSVDGGPTVRLAYDPGNADERVPGWSHQSALVVPCSTVGVAQQPGAAAPNWFKDLLMDAATYLLVYAGEDHHWPPELRPATASDSKRKGAEP